MRYDTIRVMSPGQIVWFIDFVGRAYKPMAAMITRAEVCLEGRQDAAASFTCVYTIRPEKRDGIQLEPRRRVANDLYEDELSAQRTAWRMNTPSTFQQ